MARAGVMIRFWSPTAVPAGRMPGVTRLHLWTDELAQRAGLLRRQTSPSTPSSFA